MNPWPANWHAPCEARLIIRARGAFAACATNGAKNKDMP
jgi:hypothetical protein